MDAERAVFDVMPTPHERAIWCEWLHRHSIDPSVVVVPGWIERRPEAYQVAYLSAKLDEHGMIRWDRERREPMWVIAVTQLEGPPHPFPELVPRHPDDDFSDAIKGLSRAFRSD